MIDRGFIAIFVGYAENHAGDVFRMFNPSTSRVTITRDAQFLQRYAGDYKDDTDNNNNDFEVEDTISSTNDNDRKNDDDPETTNMEVSPTERNDADLRPSIRRSTRSTWISRIDNTDVARNHKVRNVMRKLNVSWNPTLDDLVEFALVGGSDDDYENPKTFQETWFHPDSEERKK